jgi:hypothetical protein
MFTFLLIFFLRRKSLFLISLTSSTLQFLQHVAGLGWNHRPVERHGVLPWGGVVRRSTGIPNFCFRVRSTTWIDINALLMV